MTSAVTTRPPIPFGTLAEEPTGRFRIVTEDGIGIPLVATFHPAALLRNPNFKRPAWEDVQLARRIFDRA